MGQVLLSLIENSEKYTLAASCSMEFTTDEAQNIYANINEFSGEADCIIDFSNHLATKDVTAYAVKRNLPLVIATTGQSEEELSMIKKASESIPLFYSQNMSLGVAVLSCLAKITAKAFPDADIEIIEKHHNQKLDVPSGTAILLADSIKSVKDDCEYNIGRHEYGKRKKNEIGIHAVRGGSIVGEHEVLFAGRNENITLRHSALSREVFADGALKAAEYIKGKGAGMYNMSNVLEGLV